MMTNISFEIFFCSVGDLQISFASLLNEVCLFLRALQLKCVFALLEDHLSHN